VYGWIVDGMDDSAVRFAAAAMELGLQLNLSDEPFRCRGRSFARGSLLVRRTENGTNVAELVERAARAAGVPGVRVLDRAQPRRERPTSADRTSTCSRGRASRSCPTRRSRPTRSGTRGT
jgi:hypothetical protein